MKNIHPKKLLNSKWTHCQVKNKEKHFIVTKMEFDDLSNVELCVIQAVYSNNEYEINWRELKDVSIWKMGWK